MEPTDSRLQAASPRNDEADVVFDMIPLDERQRAASMPQTPTEPPADAVAGVEPAAETPLSAPSVHPPLGSISRLEAALSNLATPATPVPAPPATPDSPVVAPESPVESATNGSAAGPPQKAPSAADPIAAPTVQAPPLPSPSVTTTQPEPTSAPEIRVNAPNPLSLPPQPGTRAVAPSAGPVSGVDRPIRLPMLPVRFVAFGATTMALGLSAWQAARVINDQERLASLSLLSLVAAIVAAVAVVAWTWVVVENARRLLAPARTQELPDPAHAATTWLVPLVFIGAASAAVTYLSDRLNTPSEGTESSFPLMLALVSIVLALPLMYSPVTYLSGVVRRIGGRGVRFAEWIWVPVALSVVGVAMIAGLRLGGAFGDDFEGLAPAWVIGVAAIVPTVVVVSLGWRAAAAVETDVGRAFDRRLGIQRPASTRPGRLVSFSAAGGPNHAALRTRGYINQLPGTSVLGVAIAAGLAGLGLLSLIGALVVFLFWQETRDGVLLQAQSDRAWDLVSLLHSLERNVAFVVLVLMALWSFLAITNIRLASARRRNPVFAAAAWPVAAGGVWIVGDRLVAEGSVVEVIVGFAAQALLLAVPVFLLYRGAGSIGSRRQLLRIAWAIGVVLLVHVQGLGGLATADATVESTQVARLAGYLAIGAFLQLLVMFAAAGAMSAMTDTTNQVALRHNALVEQRQQTETSRSSVAAPPRVDRPEISGAVER